MSQALEDFNKLKLGSLQNFVDLTTSKAKTVVTEAAKIEANESLNMDLKSKSKWAADSPLHIATYLTNPKTFIAQKQKIFKFR